MVSKIEKQSFGDVIIAAAAQTAATAGGGGGGGGQNQMTLQQQAATKASVSSGAAAAATTGSPGAVSLSASPIRSSAASPPSCPLSAAAAGSGRVGSPSPPVLVPQIPINNFNNKNCETISPSKRTPQQRNSITTTPSAVATDAGGDSSSDEGSSEKITDDVPPPLLLPGGGGHSNSPNYPQQNSGQSPPPPPPQHPSFKNFPHQQQQIPPTSFSLNKNEEFGFLKPPECLVFKPNDEEFKNPLAYISKIRSVAEKYGICKIQPPKTWTPPFTVDVDKLRFTPRVQRLNELEAKTRVKLNFLDQIAKFWELQGSSLKIPMVERKALDLYTLHRIVQEEGGMEQTTKERKWSKVAQRMGYPAGKSVGTILKGHYERILHPFDIFTIGKSLANETAGDEDDDTKTKLEPETTDDQDYKPHGIVSRQQITPPNETTARRSKRFANSSTAGCGVSSYNYNHGGGLTVSGGSLATGLGGPNAFSPVKDEIKRDSSNDLSNSGAMVIAGGLMDYRRTQISGAGPKMAGNSTKSGRSRMAGMNAAAIGALGGGVKGKKQKDIDPLAKYICHICNRGDIEEAMLLCDGCDDSYHTFCLIPPLNDIPKGDWRCPKCVVEEVSKPVEAFGFEQAQREYTLQQFGEMADQFKADYFNMSVHLVPTELVEREFWRIVSSIDEDVTVEYGADLHTMDHGSGFPTKSSLYLLPGDQEYAESSWNLNNLPLLEESILGHINADISGMKVPWMYVGMCFATFCWHNEDHWSYSINYLHWGEPKTWYGVPGCKAEAFEETMKSAAPELFQSQPDLLHQLVTIMNPNILMNAGVPVYRTDQHAGEFVITFPRAYHAGFNQGYNFAEAVNFAPADWMKMGRECINHYSTLRRFCVFSHDELVCKMALDPDKLNLGIATACYLDMAEMVDSEKKLRKSLLDWGVTKAERSAFELIPDDERQCESCKTTCFLSAVTCTCTTLIVCLRHYTELCECSPDKHTLKYRYTLDELPLMLKKLKVKAESFENWLSKVRDVLDPNTPTSITLEELQELAQEAEDKKFPSSILLERLNSAVLEAEKCVTVIQQLDINKMRTRTRNSSDAAKYKLTLDELEMFVQEIDNLCCVIQEGQSVRELQALGKEFLETAKQLLSEPIYKVDEMSIEKIIEEGSTLCIELPEIKLLKDRLQQVNWYNRVREFRDAQEKIPIVDIHTFLKEGLTIAPDAVIEKELYELQEILMSVEDLEVVAKRCFESDTQHELPEIELLLERADDLEGELPSQAALKDAVKKAKEWLQIVEILQSNESYPYFHTLESLVNRGKNIPFQLEELKRMEEHLSSARSWKERTSRTFLKKQTTFNLLDVLSPRSEAVMYGSKTKKKSMEEQFTEEMSPVQMVNAFKNSEEKEILEIRQLRKQNMEKNPTEDKYCKCKRKFQGLMYQCQLCKDWFHETCVPPPKNTVRPRPSNTTTPTNALNVPQLNTREKDRESKYLCQSCMRSRRPRLETILSLLVSLQRLPIRLPEGEALQCLTERAMNWQDRVRQAFSTEDVVSALAMLSNISQKNSATSAGIDAKLAADDEYAAKHANKRRSQTAMIRTNTSDDEMDTSSEDEGFSISSSSAKVVLGQHQQQATLGNSGGDSSPSSPTKIEHAYSVPVPQNISSSGCFSKSISGLGAPLSKADMPLITLAKATRESLELLMMEGDLMEVSLDETLHIWRILNAAKPSISDLAYIHYKYKITPPTNEILVTSNKKKRRSEENFTSQPAKRSNKNQLSTTNSTVSTAAPSNAGGATGGPSNIGGSVSKIKRGRKMKMVTKETDAAITLPVSSSATSGIGMPEIKKRKRGKKAARQEQVAIAASTSDDDEECSAANCARPSGREVDWVQCDGGCNKWFHMYCVGLDKDQIKPDDDFICKRCKKAAAVANFVAADLAESVAAVAETTTGERSPYTNEASERGGGGGEEEDAAAAATTGAASNSGLAASNTNLSSSSNGAGGGGEESDTIVTSGVGKGGRKKANIATTTTTTATNSSLLPNSIKNNSGSSTISHSGEKKIDCDFDTKNKLEEGDGVANDDDDDEDDNGEDNIDETTAPTTRRSAAAAAAVAATATTTGDVETNSSSTTMSQINMGGGGGGGGGNDASNPTTTATKNPRRRKRYRAKGKKQKNRTTPPLPKKIKTTKKQ